MADGVIFKFDGRYEFLSNMFVDDRGFCVEILYQAEKATNASDKQRILSLKTGREAKAIGGKITLRPDWEKPTPNGRLLKLEVMAKFVDEKFNHPPMAQLLLDTDNLMLIEGNWWHDIFFGVCTGMGRSRKCGGLHIPFGDNHLGITLMQKRARLRGMACPT